MRFNVWILSVLMASQLTTMVLFWSWVLRPWAEDIERRRRSIHRRHLLLALDLAPHAKDCPAYDVPTHSCSCHISQLRHFIRAED